jgi:hypothetical protein
MTTKLSEGYFGKNALQGRLREKRGFGPKIIPVKSQKASGLSQKPIADRVVPIHLSLKNIIRELTYQEELSVTRPL